jgi:fucose 4-O-acetylase-like acetyltransferase
LNILNKKNRLDWIDYARGIAIILVVYRHMFEGLKNTNILREAGVNMASYGFLEQANIFFFSFRMPLFFLVSGIFIGSSLAKRGLKSLIGNKAKTILYPYFLWGFIQITIQIIFSAFTNSDKSINDYTYLFYVPREVEQFWYLYALFNIAVLYAFLKTTFKLSNVFQIILGLVLFVVSALFSQYGVEWGFISDIFHYYIFLALGDLAGKSMVNGNLRSFFLSTKAVLLLFIPFLALQYYFLEVNIMHKDISPKYLYVEYYQPFMYLLIALTGCAFIISLSSLFEKYNTAKWLKYLGRHSLYIYVMHVIFFAGCRALLIYVFNIYNVYVLMIFCIAAGLLFPILFFRISEKIGWSFLFTLESPKKLSKKNTESRIIEAQPT